MSYRSLLQGICLTQGSNPHLLHWQADSFLLSPREAPFSSLMRDQTLAPCIGSVESGPLDHQGSPGVSSLCRLFCLFVLTPICLHLDMGKKREKKNQCLRWYQFSSVQFSCSVVSDSLRPHELHAARQASLSITKSRSSFKLMSIELVMPSNHLILCHHLLLFFLASGSFPVSWLFS